VSGRVRVRTVEGLAWRRRVDCASHDWAVSRYGMLDCVRADGDSS
jgi:hypothetical protein